MPDVVKSLPDPIAQTLVSAFARLGRTSFPIDSSSLYDGRQHAAAKTSDIVGNAAILRVLIEHGSTRLPWSSLAKIISEAEAVMPPPTRRPRTAVAQAHVLVAILHRVRRGSLRDGRLNKAET